ncbi:hypothetical protein QP858_04460 [Trueperella bernardiae]|uniref:Uncharacterized protein n=1 Tax=Trueperella bernardiae TaxID=59561 RepID=A0AAW6ZJK6_9ACTO|nr:MULTISPECIES: hypothetical protein [Trueperella]MDK8601715.1 hypothetical protein [Trueperella bernardiae]
MSDILPPARPAPSTERLRLSGFELVAEVGRIAVACPCEAYPQKLY